jgi:hypothetical protein
MAGINFIEGGEYTPPLRFRNEISESCSGRRYNFKKGFEECKNTSKCNCYLNFISKKSNCNELFFYKVNDFRKCKRYDKEVF